MITVLRQAEVGACDFLDVLEEAALFRSPVEVTLRSSETFTDTVCEVITEAGENHVVFAARGRFKVADLDAITRAARPPQR